MTSMKQILGLIGVLAIVLSIPSSSVGQIAENPSKPIAKDAGRLLKLTEVWRINDEGGEFYFRRPYNLQVADDDSIFIADQDELLRLSSEGKFIKNIFMKGQGPGEINDSFMYFIQGRDVFIQDLMTQRLWRSDFDGVFQEQIIVRNTDFAGLIGLVPDGFVFLRLAWPPRNEWTGKLIGVPHIVELVARDDSRSRAIATFNPRSFLSQRSATSWDSLSTALSNDGKLLYSFCGRDYLIEVVDMASGKIIRRFRRDYPKVPYVEKGPGPRFRRPEGAPNIEYEHDIYTLFPFGKSLWVLTSTADKAKGSLFDVFDKDGRFIDSFFLGSGRTLMAFEEGCIFCQEKNEDETIMIVKYRIDANTP
ncbi:MAG: hypothetical protein NT147_07500 [Candidatus Aminicenantes bacterium]|nr:hypothetical protein [Candidatus Aminicenantes bacterium]